MTPYKLALAKIAALEAELAAVTRGFSKLWAETKLKEMNEIEHHAAMRGVDWPPDDQTKEKLRQFL